MPVLRRISKRQFSYLFSLGCLSVYALTSVVAFAGQPGQNGRVASAQSAMPEMLPLRETDPREVGAYRLRGRLGEGGQGVVFLAVSPDGSWVAVKLLPPTTDPQIRSRFLKEVAAAQRVARFCTAQVVDAGIFERRPFIVSEYVSGPSLVELVEQFGPRADAALERIAVATLTALGAVHAVGMVHRDFKPGNVLLGPDGPVVIDFGLAAVPGMTTTGFSGQTAIGTPAFMAPEHLAGERVTAAADMWSWAVTMAFAGTGRLPFKGESLTATAFAILNSEPSVGRLPEPLGSLVHRCLSKNPARRPSAHAALSELVAAGARLVGPIPPTVSALATDPNMGSSALITAPPPKSETGSGDDLIIGGLTPRPHRRRRGKSRASPRWRAVAVVTSVLLVAGASGLVLTLSSRRAPVSERGVALEHPTRGPTGTSPIAAEAKARAQAINWILEQASPAEGVSCDAQVCADLADRDFPISNLQVIGPGSNDPLGYNLVVATDAVRNQFGSRLDVYAPVLIASFGTGNARIDIRWVYPGGAAAYDSAWPAAQSAREGADAELLTNPQVKLSATAKRALLRGQVDPMLLDLIVTMAHYYPLRVVDFVDQSPGGGSTSLLRWVDLATTVPAAHLTRAIYVDGIRSFINTQRAEYKPDWDQQATVSGQAVLRIGYGAPSPLSPPSPLG
jgi:serine/threonine protein kinase